MADYVYCEDCNMMTVAHIGTDKTRLDESSEHFGHKIDYERQISRDLAERGSLDSRIALLCSMMKIKRSGFWKGLALKAEDIPPRLKSRFTPTEPQDEDNAEEVAK